MLLLNGEQPGTCIHYRCRWPQGQLYALLPRPWTTRSLVHGSRMHTSRDIIHVGCQGPTHVSLVGASPSACSSATTAASASGWVASRNSVHAMLCAVVSKPGLEGRVAWGRVRMCRVRHGLLRAEYNHAWWDKIWPTHRHLAPATIKASTCVLPACSVLPTATVLLPRTCHKEDGGLCLELLPCQQLACAHRRAAAGVRGSMKGLPSMFSRRR